MLSWMEAKITSLKSVITKNSRGLDTVQTTLGLEDRSKGSFIVPSGESSGGYEAVALPAEKAVEILNNDLSAQIIGKTFDPESLDEYLISLDGTKTKSSLGGNTLLSISVAFVKALANLHNIELFNFIHDYLDNASSKIKVPSLMINMIEGGKHADNKLDIQ